MDTDWTEAALALRRRGKTIRAIAQILGKPRTAVHNVLLRAGLTTRAKVATCETCGAKAPPRQRYCSPECFAGRDHRRAVLEALRAGMTYRAALRSVLGYEPSQGQQVSLRRYVSQHPLSIPYAQRLECCRCGVEFEKPRRLMRARNRCPACACKK